MTDTEIQALSDRGSWTEVFDEPTTVALELADAMCGETASLATELVDELRFHYSEVELAELILVCGQANLNNRAGNAAKQLLGEGS